MWERSYRAPGWRIIRQQIVLRFCISLVLERFQIRRDSILSLALDLCARLVILGACVLSRISLRLIRPSLPIPIIKVPLLTIAIVIVQVQIRSDQLPFFARSALVRAVGPQHPHAAEDELHTLLASDGSDWSCHL